MSKKITLGPAGRVVIPKALRDELNLATGDTFEIENSGQQIVLRPVRPAPALRKEKGMWVYYGGKPLGTEAVDATLRTIREERDAKNLGKR